MRLPGGFVLLLAATLELGGLAPSRASAAKLPSSISKDEIFLMLVPDYKSRREEAAAHPDDPAYSPFRIDVADSLDTDFGISGRHYLLVAVQATQGFCGGCYPTYFGIIDLDSRTLVWTFVNIGLYGAPNLKVFELPRGKPIFSFRRVEGSQGCCSSTIEDWYQPRRRKSGLDCTRIWSGRVHWENAGNRGGTQEVGCGRMAREPGGRFLYSTVTTTSFDPETPCPDPDETLKSACSKSIPDLCGDVQLMTTERWDLTDSGLKRTERKVGRKDRASSEIFPFHLDVRSPGNYLTEPSDPAKLVTGSVREVVSPDGRYQIEPMRNGIGREEVRLVSRIDAETLRVVKMSDGDRFEGELLAVGWMGDSSRFFAVVRFGYLEHQVLLSFAVPEGEDLWEKLLADDAAKYSDGFVLTSRSWQLPLPPR